MKNLFTIFFTTICLVGSTQTTLINPATAGGLESGATFAANGWTAVNDANSQWYVGTFAVNAGIRGVYVDSNGGGGLSNNYQIGAARVSHFYRTVTVTAAEPYLTLNFNWKGVGEACCDYLRVSIVPSATVPVAGTLDRKSVV